MFFYQDLYLVKLNLQSNKILNADEAFVLSASILEDRIFLSWDIKPGYYLYKKSILIKSGDEVLEYNYLTKYESKIFDEFFGDSSILKGILKVEAELLNVNLSEPQGLSVTYQGCAEGKYCYPKIIKSL